MSDAYNSASALEDFRRARLKASLQDVVSRLTGSSKELFSYDEVRRQLKAVESPVKQLKEISLDAIIGSVGRYHDFTRDFLPRSDSDKQRWTAVKTAMLSPQGVPPIEVYQIGDAYFVKDGNHRVSVAKDMNFKTLEAYVTVVHSVVPLTPDIDPAALIIKSEYAEFLRKTDFRTLHPEADFSVTVPGQYEVLLDHIEVHQYFMGIDLDRPVKFEEAVTHWYDTVYKPATELLRERGILQAFSNRTVTDLYVYLAKHRDELEQALGWGWQLRSESVVDDLAEALGVKTEDKPPLVEYLFDDILVAISGTDASWQALEQALVIAKRENARLYGLHAVTDTQNLLTAETQRIKTMFDQRCYEAGVVGQLAIEAGAVVNVLSARSVWADIVVASLSHPNTTTSVWLNTGFHALLRGVSRPVLLVPGQQTGLQRPVLAYDGTAKSELALYIATYLVKRWNLPLDVITIKQRGRTNKTTLDKARHYLKEHEVQAKFWIEPGKVVETILTKAFQDQNDLLILGSYEYSLLLEPLLGGTLDEFLRQCKIPMLICQ
jgi:nucleotide-binding universal stress UspA family protein